MERIAVRCQLERDRIPELRRLHAETWWAADRDEARVAQIVAGSAISTASPTKWRLVMKGPPRSFRPPNRRRPERSASLVGWA
jgi:hypothetical protein